MGKKCKKKHIYKICKLSTLTYDLYRLVYSREHKLE